jgi:hypothetical protein
MKDDWKSRIPFFERLVPDMKYREMLDLGRQAEWWRAVALQLDAIANGYAAGNEAEIIAASDLLIADEIKNGKRWIQKN